jgi:hypothetical protein
LPNKPKHDPISYRPDAASGLRERLLAYAERTGKAVNAVINDAVAAYLDQHDSDA